MPDNTTIGVILGVLAIVLSFFAAGYVFSRNYIKVSPNAVAVIVPARHAYSHCASVGSENCSPVRALSQSQNSKASCHDSRTAGCRGSPSRSSFRAPAATPIRRR